MARVWVPPPPHSTLSPHHTPFWGKNRRYLKNLNEKKSSNPLSKLQESKCLIHPWLQIYTNVLHGLPCLLGTSILSCMVCSKFPLFTYIAGSKWRHYIIIYRFLFWRTSKVSIFFLFFAMGQSKWFIKNTKLHIKWNLWKRL